MKILIKLFLATFTLVIIGAGLVLGVLLIYGHDLPDHRRLQSYEPDVVTRIHAFDGQMFDQVASENRVFAPIYIIPQKLVNGFIAVEDKMFYDHFGVDPIAIARAVLQNITRYQDGKRPVGASTITQQVAKNFLLDNTLSYERKIREAIIAIRLEQALGKNRIMELYLNDIYLGRGNHGVAAASLDYFNKSMDELSVAEIAFLAALPKAPNRYSLPENKDIAIERRNWVIKRMRDLNFISLAEAQHAIIQPLGIKERSKNYRASYFLAETKRRIKQRFPRMELSKDGLYIKTTLSPAIQELTTRSFRQGLESYDRRHGYRGAVTSLWGEGEPKLVYQEQNKSQWLRNFEVIPPPPGMLPFWRLAVVTQMFQSGAQILLKDGSEALITNDRIGFDTIHKSYTRPGTPVSNVANILKVGDVVLVSHLKDASQKHDSLPIYTLKQIPEINGGVVVMNVHTGRVLALQGGWSFQSSEFNRVTQAYRQVGSSIKPFVYAVALEHGMNPSTLILDAPFVAGSLDNSWKPENFTKRFLGEQPMRVGLEKSLNTMTVRLAHQVGIGRIIKGLQRFGIADKIPPELSVVLGAHESSVIRMAAAYASLVNNGYKVEPSLIDKIQDRYGKVIYKLDSRPCPKCEAVGWNNQFPPFVESQRALIIDPTTAYQIVHMLEGVVARGSGVRLRDLNLPIAGKTGTTNEKKDAWFFGLTADIVVGVYVGFDLPQNLGRSGGREESGATVALPIFKGIVSGLNNLTGLSPFHVPSGIRLVRIDRKNGKLPDSNTTETILEAYKAGQEPGAKPQKTDLTELANALQLEVQLLQEEKNKQTNRPLSLGQQPLISEATETFIGPVHQPFYHVNDESDGNNFSSTIY